MGWLLVTAALIVVVATAQQPRLRTQSLPSLPPGSLDKLFASRTAEYGTLSPQWISAGFTLSARRGVFCSKLASIEPDNPVHLIATISADGLRFTMQPPLLVDVVWPLANVEVRWIHYAYGGAVTFDTRHRGFALPLTRSRVEQTITELITTSVKNTPLARRGYNPFTDPNPTRTLEMLTKNMPTAANACSRPMQLGHLSDATGSISLLSSRGYARDGLELKAGGVIHGVVELRGKVQDHLRGRNMFLERASLTFQPNLVAKTLAEIRSVTLFRGGRMDVSYISILDGLRAIGNLIASRGLSAGTSRTAVGSEQVHAFVEARLKTWLDENYSMVPGYDLRVVLGMK